MFLIRGGDRREDRKNWVKDEPRCSKVKRQKPNSIDFIYIFLKAIV
jgi:hypothetical protein